MTLHIYTDGSCLNNPGPGGWAALLILEGKAHRLQGGEPYTTNNRMELLAVIESFEYAQAQWPALREFTLSTDSSWVVNTMTKNWKRKKNLDLWERLMPLIIGKKITWKWVKGHAGHPENEDCDARALAEAKKQARLSPLSVAREPEIPGGAPTLF